MTKLSQGQSAASAVDDCAQAVNESWQARQAQHSGVSAQPASDTRELRETAYGSPSYKTTLALRQRVLREPLGLNLWHENLSVEVNQRHFSLWLPPDQLLACVVIVPLATDCVKLRQMAVNPDYQRQGLGQQLISAVEAILVAEGIALIELHARVSVLSFYQGCGYQSAGEQFTEVGIAHQRMTKRLTAATSTR